MTVCPSEALFTKAGGGPGRAQGPWFAGPFPRLFLEFFSCLLSVVTQVSHRCAPRGGSLGFWGPGLRRAHAYLHSWDCGGNGHARKMSVAREERKVRRSSPGWLFPGLGKLAAPASSWALAGSPTLGWACLWETAAEPESKLPCLCKPVIPGECRNIAL